MHPAFRISAVAAFGILSRVALWAETNPKSSESDNLAKRIARIENGLLPPVAINGKAVKPMSLADRMNFYHVPGMSVAFIDHGRITWTRTYGYADLATHSAVTTDTIFQAASISKPLTAVAAMGLVERGSLRLDVDVNTELKTWKIPQSAYTQSQTVTLRRLLSHTAGITVSGFRGYCLGDELPTLEQILNGAPPANTPSIHVDTIPGTLWRYSGGGYVITRQLMEDVTGEPFADYMKRAILNPLGMTHSTFVQPLPTGMRASAATAYDANGQPFAGGKFFVYPELAPDGLWSTPSDIARFAIEVQNEYSGKSTKLLKQSTVHEMLERERDDWGIGFQIEPPGHTNYFRHTGSQHGFKSTMVAFDQAGSQGIVVMINGDEGALRGEYIRAVAKEYSWPEFQMRWRTLGAASPALYPAYSGDYQSPELGLLHVTAHDGKLFVQAHAFDDEDVQELLPESATHFFVLSDDIIFDFRRDGSSTAGLAGAIKLVIRGVAYTAMRVR
jgi:CubicO group peptidase (beta-lactamase class C family)